MLILFFDYIDFTTFTTLLDLILENIILVFVLSIGVLSGVFGLIILLAGLTGEIIKKGGIGIITGIGIAIGKETGDAAIEMIKGKGKGTDGTSSQEGNNGSSNGGGSTGNTNTGSGTNPTGQTPAGNTGVTSIENG